MTKEEYENFRLRYKGCGACFPIYSELSRFEKMWFTAIQKDVTELTEQNTSLLTSVENLNKSVQELEKENAELRHINSVTLSQLNLDNGELITELTKAKEIIKDLLSLCEGETDSKLVFTRAEQFLSEVEK